MKHTFETNDPTEHISDVKADNPWSVLKIMSEFVQGFERLKDLDASVTIFGSARAKPGEESYEMAVKVGKAFADAGFNVITGGGGGIMEAANKGAFMSGKAKSIGLNIRLPHEQKANQFTTLSKEFDYFFVRKVMLIKYSYAYIVMPGGFGTFDELFEALTLVQTGKIFPITIVLIGTDFWSPLVDFLRLSALRYGMISPEDMDLIQITDSVEEALQITKQNVLKELQALKENDLENTNAYKKLKKVCNDGKCLI